jgi:hypothetical protein
MIIVWGTHHYGKVDGHGTEYMCTRFAHLYFVPLFPMGGSRWVLRGFADDLLGYDVPISGRSVLATYLRVWAPIVAIALGATFTIWGLAAAALLAVLSGWSWMWRSVHGRELRRAQLNQLAFGTACDPLRRPMGQCIGLRREVEERFAEVSNGRTPDDVARLGADTALQAALAYGCLRVAAATAERPIARKAREASERVLDRMTDRDVDALSEGGPYRARPVSDATPAALETAAANVMEQRDRAFAEAVASSRTPTGNAWDNDPNNPAVKAEIARNKAERSKKLLGLDLTWKGWALLIAGALVLVPAVGYALYNDEMKARKAMAELRDYADDLCDCQTQRCIAALVSSRNDAMARAEETARDGLFQDSNADDVTRRAISCIQQGAGLPYDSSTPEE